VRSRLDIYGRLLEWNAGDERIGLSVWTTARGESALRPSTTAHIPVTCSRQTLAIDDSRRHKLSTPHSLHPLGYFCGLGATNIQRAEDSDVDDVRMCWEAFMSER